MPVVLRGLLDAYLGPPPYPLNTCKRPFQQDTAFRGVSCPDTVSVPMLEAEGQSYLAHFFWPGRQATPPRLLIVCFLSCLLPFLKPHCFIPPSL
jgi:hypothetical protein